MFSSCLDRFRVLGRKIPEVKCVLTPSIWGASRSRTYRGPADLDQRAEVVSMVELLPALLHTLLLGRKLLCVAWTWESAGTCRGGLT